MEGIVQIVCIVLLFLFLPRLLWKKKKEADLEGQDDKAPGDDKMS